MLKFSSLLEPEIFWSLLVALTLSWLAEGNGSGDDLLKLVVCSGEGVEAVDVV